MNCCAALVQLKLTKQNILHNMKKALNITLTLVVGTALISACTAGGDNPGIEYAPDMYVSKGYESMTQVKDNPFNPGGSNVRVPAKGTVARGQSEYVYPYPNTPQGYAQAGQELKSPLENTAENRAEGKRLFETFCDHCHGTEGNNGPIMSSGKYPGPGFGKFNSDAFRAIAEGNMYHTITYGKGKMGSHATQLNPTQRWKIISYLKFLAFGAATESAPADTTATPEVMEETAEAAH